MARSFPLLALLAALSVPTWAQQTGAVDSIARTQISHLKEMIELIEQKNKQLRDADILANDQRFKAQEQAVASALQAVEKGTTKTDTATEKRFDGVNEFRNQLKDQAGTFITRNEMWGWLVALIMMGFAAFNAFKNAGRDHNRRETAKGTK